MSCFGTCLIVWAVPPRAGRPHPCNEISPRPSGGVGAGLDGRVDIGRPSSAVHLDVVADPSPPSRRIDDRREHRDRRADVGRRWSPAGQPTSDRSPVLPERRLPIRRLRASGHRRQRVSVTTSPRSLRATRWATDANGLAVGAEPISIEGGAWSALAPDPRGRDDRRGSSRRRRRSRHPVSPTEHVGRRRSRGANPRAGSVTSAPPGRVGRLCYRAMAIRGVGPKDERLAESHVDIPSFGAPWPQTGPSAGAQLRAVAAQIFDVGQSSESTLRLVEAR